MKSVILASILALAACEAPPIPTRGYSSSNELPALCIKGAKASEEYATLMKRSLALNSIEGGLLYIELQDTKADLDILLKDACGIEIPTAGTMI